jgi:hypothetical protein
MNPNRNLAPALGAGVAFGVLFVLAGCSLTIQGGGSQYRQDDEPAGVTPPPAVEARSLVGVWQIDLRPTPDAEPYYEQFVVESVDGKTFTGTFYGSEVSEARLNTDWGAVYFSFITMDSSGAYLHAGMLRDGLLVGTTNSTGREFLSVWTGERGE